MHRRRNMVKSNVNEIFAMSIVSKMIYKIVNVRRNSLHAHIYQAHRLAGEHHHVSPHFKTSEGIFLDTK